MRPTYYGRLIFCGDKIAFCCDYGMLGECVCVCVGGGSLQRIAACKKVSMKPNIPVCQNFEEISIICCR